MFGQVVVHDIQSLGVMPSLGAMIGSVHSPEVLERLNMASGGGVIFGQPGDPYRERYQALRSVLMNNLSVANEAIIKTHDVIVNPDRMYAITSEEQLNDVPPIMQLPIVTYAPVRQLLEAGRIDGYSIDPRFLPDEDVYGRLCNNGRVDTFEPKEEVTWCWRSDDPELTDEDIEAIDATRGFIDRWLVEQMRPGGAFKDPTDPSNTISKSSKKKE